MTPEPLHVDPKIAEALAQHNAGLTKSQDKKVKAKDRVKSIKIRDGATKRFARTIAARDGVGYPKGPSGWRPGGEELRCPMCYSDDVTTHNSFGGSGQSVTYKCGECGHSKSTHEARDGYSRQELEDYIKYKESQLKQATSSWMKAEIKKGIELAKQELKKIGTARDSVQPVKVRAKDVGPDDGPHKFQPMPGNRKNQPCNKCLELKSHPNHSSGKDSVQPVPVTKKCPTCAGVGERTTGNKCVKCDGTGKVKAEDAAVTYTFAKKPAASKPNTSVVKPIPADPKEGKAAPPAWMKDGAEKGGFSGPSKHKTVATYGSWSISETSAGKFTGSTWMGYPNIKGSSIEEVKAKIKKAEASDSARANDRVRPV